MTKELYTEATEYLYKEWGNCYAPLVIRACSWVADEPWSKMTISEFFGKCIACGGNWGAMLLTGIKKCFPVVYDAIPEDMGHNAFFCLGYVLHLCGVDFGEED